MNRIPEVLNSYRVYTDSIDLLGTADVELPDFDPLSEKIKGAGVAGEVEVPIIGHYGSMSVKISWRVLNKPVLFLSQQKAHTLDIRGAIQQYDSASGEYIMSNLKVTVRGVPKKTKLGKLDNGQKMDSSVELEVSYIKITIDNTDVLEIDKYNYICKINGVDYLEAVRESLGLM